MKKSPKAPNGSSGTPKRSSGMSAHPMAKTAEPRPRQSKPEATASQSQKALQEKDSAPVVVAGLTKLTRGDLMERAGQLGLPVSPSDRKIDLIDRIRNRVSASPPAKKTAKAAPGKTGKLATKNRTPAPVPMPPPVPAMTGHLDPADQSARDETAPGWKYFLDIPYEPFRRESGHFISILPVDPHRIMAFFSVDWTIDPDLSRNIRESGVVLKIRDITGSMNAGRDAFGQGDLPADHIFDIMAGTSDRWAIPLWSAHRHIEAWLGYYQGSRFHVLARSKRVRTPRGAPSQRRGTLFHLKEEPPFPMPDTEASWEYSISRRWIKLPTSREIPGRSTTP